MNISYIDLLEDDAKRKEEEIAEIGKDYNMVTEFSSLIILQDLDQYLEHEIAPPRSLPDVFIICLLHLNFFLASV
jgi:hypothetical protein